MGLPMLGSVRVVVAAVRDVDLHGDLYFDLAVTPVDAADGAPAVAARVPSSSCPRRPVAGDEVELEVLMGQVQALRFSNA